MTNAFNPTRPMIRSVFAAAALVSTLTIAVLIGSLAQNYATAGQVAQAHTIVVASISR